MINATSLRTNNDYSLKQSPSFGKSEARKNNRARNIAIAVGVAGATAVTAYALRGQLARIGFVKDMLGYAGKAIGKTLDMGIKTRDFIKDKQPVQKIKTVIPELKNKVASNGIIKTVTGNIKEATTKLFGKIKSANIKEEVKDLGSVVTKEAKELGKKVSEGVKKVKDIDVKTEAKELGKKISEGVKKVKDIDVKTESKELGKKVSEGVKKVKAKGSAETVNQIKTEFSEKLTKAKEILDKSRTRASINEALTSVIESAKDAIEKMKKIRKR